MLQKGSAATADSKKLRRIALKVPQKVQLNTWRVVLWRKNGLKLAFSKYLSPVKWQRGSNGREGETNVFWGRPPPPPPLPIRPTPVLNHP